MPVVSVRRTARYVSDPRLLHLLNQANVTLAIDFSDFAGAQYVRNRAFGATVGSPSISTMIGTVNGGARITADGLVLDGVTGSNVSFSGNTFGLGFYDQDWFVSLGITYEANGSNKGAFFKVGNSTTGAAVGTGGTNFDNTGNRLIGLAEGVAWVDTSVDLASGYQSITFWKRHGAGDAFVFGVNGTEVYSTSQSMTTQSGDVIYIGGYDATSGGGAPRFFKGVIHWVVAGTTGRSLTNNDPCEIQPGAAFRRGAFVNKDRIFG